MSILGAEKQRVQGRSPWRGHGGVPHASLSLLFWVAVLVLFAIAVGMRLYGLGLPFDRDTYDEGVYWQSLRAMSAGHPLYQQIFYSQPPLFLLITYPSYALLGGTLWSARFSIALVSLFGLLGAFLLGKALAGRVGAIAALLLVVVNPLYLAQSQTIQAEAPFAAFSLLAVGLAYLWWEHPQGIQGIVLAALAGITLSLSILCKLFGAAAIAPLALLMLARLWLIWQRRGILPILVGIAGSLLTILLVMLPFIGSLHTLIQSVISFHTDAAKLAGGNQQGNISLIAHALFSILTLAALYGTLAALLRRDWRVLPLLSWLFVTVFLLWHQVPLFAHHLIALIPPLIALTVMGIGKWPAKGDPRVPTPHPLRSRPYYDDATHFQVVHSKGGGGAAVGWGPLGRPITTWLTMLALLLILATVVLNVREDRQYYRVAEANSQQGLPQQQAGQQALRAAADLKQAIAPDQLVVTDAQFVAALADRNTPPSLVDTSQVRITSGYLTLQQLIATASDPHVHAILFFTGRLQLPQLAPFYTWVIHHFHLLHTYGNGMELWVR